MKGTPPPDPTEIALVAIVGVYGAIGLITLTVSLIKRLRRRKRPPAALHTQWPPPPPPSPAPVAPAPPTTGMPQAVEPAAPAPRDTPPPPQGPHSSELERHLDDSVVRPLAHAFVAEWASGPAEAGTKLACRELVNDGERPWLWYENVRFSGLGVAPHLLIGTRGVFVLFPASTWRIEDFTFIGAIASQLRRLLPGYHGTIEGAIVLRRCQPGPSEWYAPEGSRGWVISPDWLRRWLENFDDGALGLGDIQRLLELAHALGEKAREAPKRPTPARYG